MKMRNMPGRLSLSRTDSASKPGTAWRQRLEGSDSVITEMSAGLKDTSRGPEGGVKEGERRKGANICWCAFSTQLPFNAMRVLLTPANVFSSIKNMAEINYSALQSSTKAMTVPNTHSCLQLALP